MAVERITARTARLLIDDGTDTQGNAKTANVNVTGLSVSGWDGDKFIAVASALEQCLDSTLNSIAGGTTFTLTAS